MLAILDYDAGNIESVRLALRHVGGAPEFVRDADAARKAERIVFPGVGSAGQCMRNLRARGFDTVLHEAVAAGKPVLAICIGMQLVFDRSEEDGGVDAVGMLPGTVRKFTPTDPSEKVPHMGWNRTTFPRKHPLLADGVSGADFYFVHSYYVEPAWDDAAVRHGDDAPGRDAGVMYGYAEYAGGNFTAIAGRGSLFATQFHPEKSGAAGLDILARFLGWDGAPC